MKLNIKDLSEEQIKDLELQLQEYRKPKEPHYTDVKSWEDAFEIVKPEWYINTDGLIRKLITTPYTNNGCMNNIPSELQAKSILATCRLMVIAEALNEGWKPDWNSMNQKKYSVYYNHTYGILSTTLNWEDQTNTIYFKSKELAEYAMKQFKELFLDMLMIER